MQSQLPIYPEQASNFAPNVDSLMLFITAICLFFAVAVTVAIVIFFFKFHRKAPNDVGVPIHGDSRLEAAWMIIPLILAMAMFSWGAVVRPTKPGRYHFFCSQYCGTNHALMGGWVTVMEPSDYAAWLSGSSGGSTNPLVAGEKLFAEKACITCHVPDGSGRSPSLNGLYGAKVLLADGSTVTADESYIRESILQPNAKIVAGYPPLMPTFQGQLTEEQILALTAYIKSLQSLPVPAKGSGIAPPTGNK